MTKVCYTTDELAEALAQQMEELRKLDVGINVNGTMKRVVRNEMRRIQASVQQSYRAAVPSDPRQSWKAVKFMVYKKRLGGNVSVFSSKKSSGYAAAVTRSGGNSGIKRKRHVCKRTQQMEGYWGVDRNFMLNWFETGTKQRTAGARGNSRGGSGNRGSLPQREFFPSGAAIAEQSVEVISNAYDTLIGKTFDEN